MTVRSPQALASALIPGGVGTFVSVAKSSDWLEGIPVQTPPTKLRNANRKKLAGMGVYPDVIDLFLGNTVYSPVQQTKLVQALARMNNTEDRGKFVKFAVLARDGKVAFFRAPGRDVSESSQEGDANRALRRGGH